ncbi:LysR family transcriptional regulator [Paratractidigestivibacter sp.]|uniref:LysR family transcriptional regulator n=1 Tax=Paratractidigestivibacter sp. TaxID=2847316 RepID=UPI002AC999D3|nr:LysR family transcriptional regulator [Paratractidigestivibacter sp.]
MTLQQLRYLISVAEYGSINAAAGNLYTSQSNVSAAISELERELGVEVFTRSNRGVTLTNDGTELLGYARQVVEQADLLSQRFKQKKAAGARLAVSTQHYAFSLQAFVNVVEEFRGAEFDFVLRETTTAQIIEDVSQFRSEVGVIYLDDFNKRVLRRALADARCAFCELFEADVHVFVGTGHPLAAKASVRLGDLAPYARYNFEQGTVNSFHYSEEPLAYIPCSKTIRYTDRATLTNLLTSYNGYTLSTGVLTDEMQSGIVSIPLEDAPVMRVGYIMHEERRPTELVGRYIAELERVVAANPNVEAR